MEGATRISTGHLRHSATVTDSRMQCSDLTITKTTTTQEPVQTTLHPEGAWVPTAATATTKKARKVKKRRKSMTTLLSKCAKNTNSKMEPFTAVSGRAL